MSTTFTDLGLGDALLKAIDEIGYTQPTPIQEKAIPVALQGRDVLGCAQTGTGKTASFTLPMIEILAEGRAKARMPRSLILTPTRELAAQVADNFDLYGKFCNLSKALLIGGVDITAQMRLVETGVDVLIATPGRLLDVFERGGIMLTDIQVLVIDEADRMLDMGFIPDIERIVGLLPPLRQTLFFSATMAPEIRKIADQFLQNPKEITVAPPASAATTVDQHLSVVGPRDKREALRHLIKEHDVSNAFVFCNRKRDVDVVANSLKKHGFNAGAIHGDMDQASRTETLAKFKANEITILVASDVAARGIDIQGVSHVFNFDLPMNSEDYVHRIGRTGRAGRTGCAFSIATRHDGKLIAAIEKLINKQIPRHQIDSLSVSEDEMSDEAPRKRGRGRGKSTSKSEDKSQTSGSSAEIKDDQQPERQTNDRTAHDRPADDRPANDRRGRGRGRGRYRQEDDFDPNVPTEASQLPPFITVGPTWLEDLQGQSTKKKPARKRTRKKVEAETNDMDSSNETPETSSSEFIEAPITELTATDTTREKTEHNAELQPESSIPEPQALEALNQSETEDANLETVKSETENHITSDDTSDTTSSIPAEDPVSETNLETKSPAA